MSRLYRGRYRLEGETKITEIPLHTPTSGWRSNNWSRSCETSRWNPPGCLPPEARPQCRAVSLGATFEKYVADLSALNRDGQYVYELKNRVRRLIRGMRLEAACATSPPIRFRHGGPSRPFPRRPSTNISARFHRFSTGWKSTSALPAIRSSTSRRCRRNGKQVRPRRAFTDDEMQRLLGIAGTRKVVYLTAVYTGLRRSEMAALERRDLHLEGEKPFINVRASTTKNHQQAVIALAS